METVTLKIRESIWSGRTASQPPPTERELQLPLGGTFTLSFYSQQHICAITRIEAKAVDLSPVGDAPALVNADGSYGRPMTALTHLDVGQSLKVCTWALDLGAIWDITIEHIET